MTPFLRAVPLICSAILACGWAETNLPVIGNSADTNEVTPLSLPDSEPFVFKKVENVELRLHVVKPKDWKSSDKRACLVTFFGGGWSSGTPAKSITYAKWAAKTGLVGVAPDYRTRNRFNTQPEDCVADGRASVRWVQDHAA
jgi:acetyl esterase/lipase